MRYEMPVIESFRDKTTAAVFKGEFPRRLQRDVAIRARTKLLVVDAASELDDLRSPPGNRLEALKGDRAGRHSIRVNDQFRICFVWRDGGAFDVEIADYHQRPVGGADMSIARKDLANLDISDVSVGERMPPITPGDILRTEFLEPLGLSARAAARDLGVPANRITEILNGERAITADTAILLGQRFGVGAEFWMNLQTAHELAAAREKRAAQPRRRQNEELLGADLELDLPAALGVGVQHP